MPLSLVAFIDDDVVQVRVDELALKAPNLLLEYPREILMTDQATTLHWMRPLIPQPVYPLSVIVGLFQDLPLEFILVILNFMSRRGFLDYTRTFKRAPSRRHAWRWFGRHSSRWSGGKSKQF